MQSIVSRTQEAIYGLPPASPRKRETLMKLICVGPSRSATESLTQALGKLGYATYHGWDLGFDEPARVQAWHRLARRKFRGAPDGDCHISSTEFDELLGHVDAVIDVPAFVFAPELIEAYPDAKVILNTRKDLDSWHRSIMQTAVKDVEDSWLIWFLHWFNADLFWLWDFAYVLGYPSLYRSPPPYTSRAGIQQNGKWIYRDHCNMIKGMGLNSRLLEWSVEDGWEPLCMFLEKDIPNEAFPWANNPRAYANRIDQIIKPRYKQAMRNCCLVVGFFVALIVAIIIGVRENGLNKFQSLSSAFY